MVIPSLALICGMKERINAAMKRLGRFTAYELAKEVFSDLPDETIHRIVVFTSHVEFMNKKRGDIYERGWRR